MGFLFHHGEDKDSQDLIGLTEETVWPHHKDLGANRAIIMVHGTPSGTISRVTRLCVEV
jgi:hypothetical protein